MDEAARRRSLIVLRASEGGYGSVLPAEVEGLRMSSQPQGNRASARHRRPVRPGTGTVECLEIRMLLSSAAVIQWSMAPRVTLNPSQRESPRPPEYAGLCQPGRRLHDLA